MRDLAAVARDKECQFIITTHSPYILDELPLRARMYVAADIDNSRKKEVLIGVSSEFSMSKMDDEDHPEVEVFVEDVRTAVFLGEILSRHSPDTFTRCAIIPYGTANLGVALGQLKDRFTKKTVVFLDGDQGDAPGCILLPGSDAPERVVFEYLQENSWLNVHTRVGRSIAAVTDNCSRAMTLANHHDWIETAANQLKCGSDVLWQAMCCEWAEHAVRHEMQYVIDGIGDALS